ncbi:MAG: hypothetical protein ABJA80_04040 [bacterium]
MTGGERISRGIGTALGQYQQHQEMGQADEARRRAAGQVMTTQGEGGFDRLRSLGRRLLGRGDNPVSSAPPPTFSQPQMAGRVLPMQGFSNETPPQEPAMMGGTALAQTPNHATPTPAVVAAPAPRAPRTIGSALDSYTENDNHGNTWTVDPNREANRQLAAQDAQTRNAMDTKDEYKTRDENDLADAYAKAKMTGDERDIGAFRAKSGTFKYDEEFGAPRPQAHETPAEHAARDQANIAARGVISEKLSRLNAAGRGNTPEARQLQMELRKRSLDQGDRRLDLYSAESERRANQADFTNQKGIAGLIGSSIPKDPLGIAPPAQKAAIARGTAQRDQVVRGAATQADRIAHGHATPEKKSARIRELMSAPNADPAKVRAQMLSEGYRFEK